jgi:pimeloyl-ACP methyl ester carboxylesterase
MNFQERTISTEGRQLRIIEAGQLDGVPVLVHNGTPSSRLFYHAWVEDAHARGIRLISYDRPGYGGSTPCPGRNVASAAGDVAAIAKALGLERLLVWGVSGGGPHALACAALLPGLVVAAASLASPAPYQSEGLDWLAGMGEDNIHEFGAALKGREAIQQLTEAVTPGLLDTRPADLVQALQSLLSPVDAAAITEDLAAYLLATMIEGIKAMPDGWIDDDLAFVTP